MSKVMKSVTEGLKESDKMFLEREWSLKSNRKERRDSFSFRWCRYWLDLQIQLVTRVIRQGVSRNVENIASKIRDNEDVQFLWTMLSAEWEEGSATALLEMVVTQWVIIRGFAYASAWLEKYKAAQKKTTQKSKGIRNIWRQNHRMHPIETPRPLQTHIHMNINLVMVQAFNSSTCTRQSFIYS